MNCTSLYDGLGAHGAVDLTKKECYCIDGYILLYIIEFGQFECIRKCGDDPNSEVLRQVGLNFFCQCKNGYTWDLSYKGVGYCVRFCHPGINSNEIDANDPNKCICSDGYIWS